MDDKRRTLAAITIIIGFLVLVAVVIGALFSGKKILSPVPEDDSAIKIIIISPTPSPLPTAPVTPTTSIKPTPTKKTKPTP